MPNDKKSLNLISIYMHSQLINTVYLELNDNESITFGRAEDNDITIPSAIVSSYHFKIINIKGNFYVIDNNSTNGLIINGKKLTSHLLEDGDIVRIDSLKKPHKDGVIMVYSNISSWSTFPLKGKRVITVGRDSSNDIILPHKSVSKHHARFIVKGESVYIEDLQSTNGTYVNGELVIGRATQVSENDHIQIINTKFIIRQGFIVYNTSEKGIRIDAIGITKIVTDSFGLFKPPGIYKLVDDISFSVNPGEFVAIVGASGVGKSTLMQCLNGYTRATEGSVLLNGDNFYSNYEAYKSLLGYVPQQDIVYDNLTVLDMLKYAAQIRMPEDSTEEEINNRVAEVLEWVELQGKEFLPIKKLSGGQKKRVNMAVELIADPKLFFLDEPTSGLDPGMDKSIMTLLRSLSRKNKTILLITHSTENIHFCDKVMFIGNGGKLCFYGTPHEALKFFETDNFVDIYIQLANYSEDWADKFRTMQGVDKRIESYESLNNNIISNKKTAGALRQFSILTKRYFKLTLSDSQRLLIMLLQAPLIALLVALVSKRDAFFQYELCKEVLFAIVCAGIWIGLLNSIQEICKERTIIRREAAVNLKFLPYIMSKFAVLALFSLVQSFLLIAVISIFLEMPVRGVTTYLWFESYITSVLTIISSFSLGLLLSSFVKNSDRAIGLTPIVLMPMILFSGMMFPLKGLNAFIASLFCSRWSMSAFGISFNLNDLPLRLVKENPELAPIIKKVPEELYKFEPNALFTAWGILLIMTVLCITLSTFALKRIMEK